MKITEFLDEKSVSASLSATDKKGVISELVDLLIKAGDIKKDDKDALMSTLLNREALGSTGIGQGIGIPHGKSNSLKKLVAAFGVSQGGVDFDSLDGEPVYILFLLVAPEDSAGPHLKALARISRLLKDKFFRDTLRQAKDEKKLIKIIKDEDSKRQ